MLGRVAMLVTAMAALGCERSTAIEARGDTKALEPGPRGRCPGGCPLGHICVGNECITRAEWERVENAADAGPFRTSTAPYVPVSQPSNAGARRADPDCAGFRARGTPPPKRVRPPKNATSAELIIAAVENGELSREEYLLNMVRADTDETNLPRKLRGRHGGGCGGFWLFQAHQHWACFSPEARAEIDCLGTLDGARWKCTPAEQQLSRSTRPRR